MEYLDGLMTACCGVRGNAAPAARVGFGVDIKRKAFESTATESEELSRRFLFYGDYLRRYNIDPSDL